MQEQHFNAMVEKAADRVPTATAKDAIRAAFQAVRDDGELLTLETDEVRLLEAYRIWKRTSDAAGGVFHWKKIR